MSLDDLLSNPDVGPQEDSLRVCLAGKLLPKVKACVDELAEIEDAVNRDPDVREAWQGYQESLRGTDEDGERRASTKMAQASSDTLRERYEDLFETTREQWPGYAGKRAELEDLNERMKAAEAVIGVKADEGAWLRFVAENPPRRQPMVVKDAEGNESSAEQYDGTDYAITHGRCNADALRTQLGTWVATLDGEYLPPDKVDSVLGMVSGGDKVDLCKLVVRLHEESPTDPKAVTALLDELKSVSS